MGANLTLRSIAHHGVEGIAFVAIGTWAVSNFGTACASYAAGKVAYIATKVLLDICAPQWTQDTRRLIGWGSSLLAGATAMHITINKIAGRSMSALAAIGTTLGVTSLSIGLRLLGDRCVTYLTAP